MTKRSNVHLMPGVIEAQAKQGNRDARAYVSKKLLPAVRRTLTMTERLAQYTGCVDAITGLPRTQAAALNLLAAALELEAQLDAMAPSYEGR